MKACYYTIVLLFLFSSNSFAEDLLIPLDSAVILKTAGLEEIQYLTNGSSPENFRLQYMDDSVSFTIRGKVARTLMGQNLDEPIEITNSEYREVSINGFNCIQETFPRKTHEEMNLWRFTVALMDFNEYLDSLNVCTKHYR